jgi:glutathione S-transferase
MLTLYHQVLCPFSRKVRLALIEKRMAFELHTESVWERRDEFLALNPTGEVPVLIEENGIALSGSDVILEYLDEIQPDPSLYGITPLERAETRRLVYWFDRKFNIEVTENLVTEKIMKRLLGLGEPNSQVIRAGHTNIHTHLNYISYLVDRRNWLAGDNLTAADLAASAHLSAIDYIGDIPWNEYPAARDWYARIKSRLSFRPLLDDQIRGVTPAKHYRDLDF